MIQKPTISLHAPGVDVVLSNRAGRFVLMQGATGLGVAPRDLTVSDLPGGGGVLRHARSAVPRVTIPILLGGDYEERAADRRTLERLSEGDVEIRVTQPDGESRSRTGVYVDGLDGDYGAGEDSPDGQKLVLTFECPDFRWFGPQREESWALSPKRTAWLSRMRDEPSTPRLLRTNHVLSPRSAQSWSLSSGSGVVSSDPAGGVLIESTAESPAALRATAESSAEANARYASRVDVVPGAGVESVRVEVRADGAYPISKVVEVAEGTPATIVVEEPQARSGVRSVEVTLNGRMDGMFRLSPPAGSVTRVTGASLVWAGEDPEPFDGDSTDADLIYRWAGTPGESASEELRPVSDDVLAVPFGAMRLSESTVQGSKQVEIAGDADAEAVLIIDGPGEDLEVVNETTSQRIFITGDIDETLTIDSRGGWQDIYSDSMRDGEWWARVNEDAPEELITLAPGQNLIRVTMVNAHPQSKVRLLYRETYRAGH